MATNIVQSLFGVTPEAYQRAQDTAAEAQALQFAKLDPMARATYGIYRGAGQLGGALGRALGGEDPELARISLRQQVASQIDYSDPNSVQRAMRMLQPTDPQGAMMLMQVADQATTRQATQAEQARKAEELRRAQLAERIAQGAYQPGGEAAFYGKPSGAPQVDEEGNVMPGAGVTAPSYDPRRVSAQLQALGPAGVTQLKTMAEGTAALRKLGIGTAQEENPFTQFLVDETIPKNVKTYATQLSKSFATGAIDPEKVDVKVKELTDMTQRVQQFEQNQQQIKANQETMAEMRRQGLENSRQGLAIQQQNASLAAMNAQFNQQMKQAEVDRKAEEKRNKPLPSYLAKEEQADYEKAQSTTNLASDAYEFINRIKTGEIPFGLKEKAIIRAKQIVGSSAPDVIAREDYDRFVIRLINESLRLNKGTQTNFDFQNALKELQSSESPEAAAATMKRLVDVNLRATENAAKAVSDRRKNANFPEPANPIEVPKFDVQIINNADYQGFLKNPKYPSGTVFVDPKGVRRVKP